MKNRIRYILVNPFNGKTVSRHKTLKNAVKREKREGDISYKDKGGSYIPLSILYSNGKKLNENDLNRKEEIENEIYGNLGW